MASKGTEPEHVPDVSAYAVHELLDGHGLSGIIERLGGDESPQAEVPGSESAESETPADEA